MQIQIFENKEFGKIRIIEKDGQIWFVGKDIARILKYDKPDKTIKRLVDDEDRTKHPILSRDGEQKTWIINEFGLHSLIISSILPSAKAFKRWVTSEVLPSIRRKYGAYITDDTFRRLQEDDNFINELIEKFVDEKMQNNILSNKVERFAPKALYYDIVLQCENSIQTSIIAKDYGMSCADFNKLLHGLKIQYKFDDTWLLYKDYADKGYTVSKIYHINEQSSKIHTYWTQLGRRFLYDILKRNGIVPEAEKPGGAFMGGEDYFC